MSARTSGRPLGLLVVIEHRRSRPTRTTAKTPDRTPADIRRRVQPPARSCRPQWPHRAAWAPRRQRRRAQAGAAVATSVASRGGSGAVRRHGRRSRARLPGRARRGLRRLRRSALPAGPDSLHPIGTTIVTAAAAASAATRPPRRRCADDEPPSASIGTRSVVDGLTRSSSSDAGRRMSAAGSAAGSRVSSAPTVGCDAAAGSAWSISGVTVESTSSSSRPAARA